MIVLPDRLINVGNTRGRVGSCLFGKWVNTYKDVRGQILRGTKHNQYIGAGLLKTEDQRIIGDFEYHAIVEDSGSGANNVDIYIAG